MLSQALSTVPTSGNLTNTPVSGWAAERVALDILGYSAPLPLTEPERAERALITQGESDLYTKNPHSSQKEVQELLSDPGLVEAVAAMCGPSLQLWRSAYFRKVSGAGEIGWHHDKHFHSADYEDIQLDEIGSHFSILFGLTPIVQATGMLEVIPGTHLPIPELDRDLRPFHKRPPEVHILTDLPENILAQRRPVPIPAGCFMIFHSAILHRSLPHSGEKPRLGMAIRLCRTGLTIPSELAEPKDIVSFPPLPTA